MKKTNIFLIVLIFIIGIYLLYTNLFKPEESQVENTNVTAIEVNNETNSLNENGNPTPVNDDLKLTQEQISQQIKNKKYLEDTFMALEYSKVNNVELRSQIQAFIDDNSQMKPEDMAVLIKLHEKTFLNRYLKVFVDVPDKDLTELNSEMRRIFYQIKSGFDILHGFGSVALDVPVTTNNGDGTAVSEVNLDGNDSNTTTSQPSTSVKGSKKNEPNYDINLLRNGLQQLSSTDELVNDALKKLGSEDILIEKEWIKANLSEGDITDAIDTSNSVDLNSLDSNENSTH